MSNMIHNLLNTFFKLKSLDFLIFLFWKPALNYLHIRPAGFVVQTVKLRAALRTPP